MKNSNATIIALALLTLVVSPVLMPLAMLYCMCSGSTLRQANGYDNQTEEA